MRRATDVLVAELARFGARRLPRGAALGAAALAVSGVVVSVLQGREIEFQTALPETLRWVGQLLVFISVALGASAFAAEWNTGSLGALVTFDPNRWRVLAGKASAAAVGCAVLAAVVLAVVIASVALGATVSGTFERTDDSTAEVRLVDSDEEDDPLLGYVLELGARTAGACALAGVFGLAGGALVRRTAGVVAGFLVLFIVGEWAIGELLRVEYLWGPARSLSAFAIGPVDLAATAAPNGPYVVAALGWTVGALVLALGWFSRVEVATGPR